jgi:hypothetical protein
VASMTWRDIRSDAKLTAEKRIQSPAILLQIMVSILSLNRVREMGYLPSNCLKHLLTSSSIVKSSFPSSVPKISPNPIQSPHRVIFGTAAAESIELTTGGDISRVESDNSESWPVILS